MLLQYLLLRGKRNRARRWSEFGDYRTIDNSGRRSSGSAAIVVREDAGLRRRSSWRGSDHLSLPHLVGLDTNRRALDRLSRRAGILRHRHYPVALYLVDVG